MVHIHNIYKTVQISQNMNNLHTCIKDSTNYCAVSVISVMYQVHTFNWKK